MGSVAMAVFKILAVLVVAGPCAWTTPTTPTVPILQFIDTQNTDGSYTYGFESGDGTYKLESRYSDGRVVGKYGYFDPQGVLREASYGAEAGRGFELVIAGVELPPPTVVNEPEPELAERVIRSKVGDIKIVNGRRAVLRRRVKASPAPEQFLPPNHTQARKENNLKAQDEQLNILREQRQNLLLLQQRQSGTRLESPGSFTGFQESQELSGSVPTSDHFLSEVDLSSGSFSYSYGR